MSDSLSSAAGAGAGDGWCACEWVAGLLVTGECDDACDAVGLRLCDRSLCSGLATVVAAAAVADAPLTGGSG